MSKYQLLHHFNDVEYFSLIGQSEIHSVAVGLRADGVIGTRSSLAQLWLYTGMFVMLNPQVLWRSGGYIKLSQGCNIEPSLAN